MYWQSSQLLARQYPFEVRNLQLSVREEVVAEGERLSRTYGCTGCHGDRLQGAVVDEGPLVGRIVAQNLTRAMQTYSLDEFEAITRQGVRPDGTSLFGMPSSLYAIMTDRDFSAIASYIGQAPFQVEDPGRSRYGLLSRYKILRNHWPAEAAVLVGQPWDSGFEADELRFGEYLSQLACNSCHNPGYFSGMPPAGVLARARNYDRSEFNTLLTIGQGPGGRALAGKKQLVQQRFGYLTNAEIDALYAYLLGLDAP
jgi:mono/diheme cytochrome c family protein